MFALNCADIVVLVGFAFAQPLFDLMGRSPELLVVHHARPLEVLLLAALIAVVPAGLLIALEGTVWLLARRFGAVLHWAVVALLFSLDLLPLARRAPLPGVAAVVVAGAAAAGLARVYLRGRTWRWSLVYLCPVALFFPAWFLFFSPAAGLLFEDRAPRTVATRVGSPAPIVMVVFDEFPLASLMDRDGLIDARLYPNFAALARDATWYRNATSVGESTLIALPAILDGRYPDPVNPRLPDAAGHPDTLFTLLGASYRLHVSENNTRLCPERLCGEDTRPARVRLMKLLADLAVLWPYTVLPADLTGGLPDVTQSWKDFGDRPGGTVSLEMWNRFDNLADWHDRVEQFRAFAGEVRPSAWPTLHFLHILLPHAPWEYLPTGQKCTFPEPRIRGLRGVNSRGEDPNFWTGDEWAVAQNYQRHLLQVSLVDRLTGDLIRQLRASGMYDPSLIIITADHGTSFRPRDSRRSVTATNYPEIISVPLFIKYPGQKRGGIDDRPAESVDILPSILDVVRARHSRQLEGHSLLGPPVTRTLKTVVTDSQQSLQFPAGTEGVMAAVARKLALFGGADPLYHLGDTEGWFGRPAPADAAAEPGILFELRREGYYTNVDLGAAKVVTNISGKLRRESASKSGALKLAVAVNGVISAITWSYRDGDDERFSALVPYTALRSGRNEIALFHVSGGSLLRRIQPAPRQAFQWGQPIRFGATGDARAYFGLGWSVPEADVTWTEGHRATLYLPVAEPQTDLDIVAHAAAFTHPHKLPAQRVRVLANGREVAQWAVRADFEDYTARVPRHYVGNMGLEITFELPDATAPIVLGAGTDSRTLGLAFTTLRASVRE